MPCARAETLGRAIFLALTTGIAANALCAPPGVVMRERFFRGQQTALATEAAAIAAQAAVAGHDPMAGHQPGDGIGVHGAATAREAPGLRTRRASPP